MVDETNASSSRLNSLLVEHPDELLRVGLASFLFNGIANYSQAARESCPFFFSCPAYAIDIHSSLSCISHICYRKGEFLGTQSGHLMIALMSTGYSSCVVLLEVFRGEEGTEVGNS